MKAMLLAVLGFSFSLALAANAEVFRVPDTGISFDAPAGFTRLTPEEIATKYPASHAPAFVVGNRRRKTSIAYELKADKVPPGQLTEGLATFEQLFERLVPGLEWKEHKLIELQGQQWIYLEMTSHAVDTDIHNILLAMPYKGRLLLFNFNSTRDEFPKVEAALRRSIASITLGSV